MADNTEFLPQAQPIDPSHVRRNITIIGSGNVVDITSLNTIVSGRGNFVGEDTRGINLLGCTDCVVVSGVTNVNVINSSGVTVLESDTTYIKDIEISSDSFIVSGVTFSQGYHIVSDFGYTITLDDYTIDDVNGLSEITLPAASGHTQVFNIKITGALGDTTVFLTGLDTIEGVAQNTQLSQGDNLTVQSNGSSNYIIL